MLITSDTNQFIKLAKSLNEKKYRDKESLFLVEGLKLCLEAINSGFELKYLFYTEAANAAELESVILSSAIAAREIKVFTIQEQLMKRISNTESPQPFLGIFAKRKLSKELKLDQLNLYCENIQDPGNLGAIIRTALATNCEKIFLDNCVDIYNPKLIRASAGAVFHVDLMEMNLDKLLELKAQDPFLPRLIASSPYAATSYLDYSLQSKDEKLILMLGNEANGLSERAFQAADLSLNIPINPKLESLNVLAATTVLLFHFKNLLLLK